MGMSVGGRPRADRRGRDGAAGARREIAHGGSKGRIHTEIRAHAGLGQVAGRRSRAGSCGARGLGGRRYTREGRHTAVSLLLRLGPIVLTYVVACAFAVAG